MHFWLIQTGEPLPTDAGRQRLLRTGLLAEELVRRGHSVTWWATTFRHSDKTQRADRDTVQEVAPRYRLMLIHSPGYRTNVSFRRLIDHRATGRGFREWARREASPDAISVGFPTIETAYEATSYARERGIPCAIDARDMWPDIYLSMVPAIAKPLVRMLLSKDFRMTSEAFRNATAITAHAPGFVDWALRYAGRERSEMDQDFPFAYPSSTPDAVAVAVAERFWSERGVSEETREFRLCFFGTFAQRREVDLTTVIEAARFLAVEAPDVKFVLCGTGPAFAHFQLLAEGLDNVSLPGWIDAPSIWTLMRRSQVGLLPYLPSVDFLASMPNKSVEYLSAGLPILTSLTGGYLQNVLDGAGCGVFYESLSARSLADAVIALRSDPERLARQHSAARALFESRFRVDAVYGAMASHLESLAQRQKPLHP
jgi:glycosyltransferase involved in cell wall biosynthesis